MDVHNRYESSLFEEFILLNGVVLYCGCVGGLDESEGGGGEVDMRIRRKYWIQY